MLNKRVQYLHCKELHALVFGNMFHPRVPPPTVRPEPPYVFDDYSDKKTATIVSHHFGWL